MEKIKGFLKYFTTFLILIVFYNASLYAISLIPSKAIEKKCEESADIMIEQGPFISTGFLSLSENGTDGLIINEAYSIDSENPVESYMLVRKNYNKEVTKIILSDKIGQFYTYSQNRFDESGDPIPDEVYSIGEELKGTINGTVEVSQTYTRYYHGYLTLYRPLLLFLNITQIRWFLTGILTALFAWLMFILYKKFDLKTLLIFFGVFLSFGYFGLGQSLENTPLFIVLVISLIYLLIKIDKFDEKKLMYFLFVVASITNFVDFLTAPVLTLMMPLIVYFLYNREKYKEIKFKEIVILLIKFGIVWGFGYALTWISKAILVEILYNGFGISSLISQSMFRIGGEITDYSYRVLHNLGFGIQIVLICALTTSIALSLFNLLKIRKQNLIKTIKEYRLIVFTSLIGIAWLLVLYNHTTYHFDLFPYRNLIAPMIVLFLIFTEDGNLVSNDKVESNKDKTAKKEKKTKDEKTSKRITKFVLTFVICVVVANASLLAICLIPSDKVEENVYKSKDQLVLEGARPLIQKEFNVYNNNYTEAVIVNEIYSVDSSSPFYSYMTARKNYKEGQTEFVREETNGEGITANYYEEQGIEIVSDSYDSIGELNDFLDGNIKSSLNYGRYWHGYLVLYRPLMTIFNLSQIKTFQFLLFLVLFVMLSVLLCKKYGKTIALIMLLSIAFSGYFSASYSIESGPTHLLMIISMLIFLFRKDRIKDFYLFFLVIGVFTNFIDYLTVPLLTVFMPVLLIMIDYSKEHSLQENILYLVKICLSWGIGYAGMWITKWALYDIFVPGTKSMLKIGFEQMFYRMHRNNSYYGEGVNIMQIITPKLARAFGIVFLNIFIALILQLIDKFQSKKNNDVITFKWSESYFIFFIISFAPIAWYFLLANHTSLHFFFTYRMLVIFAASMSVFMSILLKSEIKR